MAEQELPQQNNDRLGNYLLTHRKRAGLSRREIGQLLGYETEGAVMRHEHSRNIPPLLMALGYEVVFRVPFGELFPGIQQTVERTMEARMLRFEEELEEKRAKGDRSQNNARKLAWLYERHQIYDN